MTLIKKVISDPEVPMTFDVYQSDVDGTWVVHVCTEDMEEDKDGPLIRVYLNDHCLSENPPLPESPE